MNKEFSYQTGEDILFFTINNNSEDAEKEIKITGYRGHSSSLTVPEWIEVNDEKLPVTVIGKKAFLGNHNLRRIVLYEKIKQLEDWAFAHCRLLTAVILCEKDCEDGAELKKLRVPELGKGVFDDCPKLKNICLGKDERNCLSALLAAASYGLNADYLLRDSELGSEAWFEKWDQTLLAFLKEDDEEGYTNLVLCGEEDIKRTVPDFISDKRKKKAGLCLLRLLNDVYLASANQESMTDYLLEHRKGSASDEAWQVLLSEFGDEIPYYQLFADIGGVTGENIEDMLLDMGENHAEAKAFLMEYRQKKFGVQDLFSAFEL